MAIWEEEPFKRENILKLNLKKIVNIERMTHNGKEVNK